MLEQARANDPDSAGVRLALGKTYYRIAREALDRDRDETRYLDHIELANAEFLTAIEIEPRTVGAQFYVGLMGVYRGDLKRAMRGFENSRRLDPTGDAYTNIGEIHVYLGDVEEARRWTDLGWERGAPRGIVRFNQMLIAWKSGDLDAARERFSELQTSDPDRLQNINVVRLPQAPGSFEDFAAYCCGSPACGPYLQDACASLGLAVD